MWLLFLLEWLLGRNMNPLLLMVWKRNRLPFHSNISLSVCIIHYWYVWRTHSDDPIGFIIPLTWYESYVHKMWALHKVTVLFHVVWRQLDSILAATGFHFGGNSLFPSKWMAASILITMSIADSFLGVLTPQWVCCCITTISSRGPSICGSESDGAPCLVSVFLLWFDNM